MVIKWLLWGTALAGMHIAVQSGDKLLQAMCMCKQSHGPLCPLAIAAHAPHNQRFSPRWSDGWGC